MAALRVESKSDIVMHQFTVGQHGHIDYARTANLERTGAGSLFALCRKLIEGGAANAA